MPTVAPLTTLNTCKDWIGIPLADTSQDARLTLILNGVSAKIAQICGTDFATHIVLAATPEVIDGGRYDIIIPNYLPLISVEMVQLFYDQLSTPTGQALDPDQYDVQPSGIVLRYQYTPQGRGSVAVAYHGGYAAVPDDVIQATLIAVEAMYLRVSKKTIGLTSRSKGVGSGTSEQENFGGAWDSDSGLPKDAVGLLESHRDFEWPAGQAMATRNY